MFLWAILAFYVKNLPVRAIFLILKFFEKKFENLNFCTPDVDCILLISY